VIRQTISSTLFSYLRASAGERGLLPSPPPVDDDDDDDDPRGAVRAKRERASNGGDDGDDDPRGALRAKRERASNDDPRGAVRAKREPQPPSPQAPSTLQRARPGEVRKEGRGDGLKSNSSLCDKALPVQ
jgi:hypothetical protein